MIVGRRGGHVLSYNTGFGLFVVTACGGGWLNAAHACLGTNVGFLSQVDVLQYGRLR